MVGTHTTLRDWFFISSGINKLRSGPGHNNIDIVFSLLQLIKNLKHYSALTNTILIKSKKINKTWYIITL
jgi:hypothetical protein